MFRRTEEVSAARTRFAVMLLMTRVATATRGRVETPVDPWARVPVSTPSSHLMRRVEKAMRLFERGQHAQAIAELRAFARRVRELVDPGQGISEAEAGAVVEAAAQLIARLEVQSID